MSMPEGKGAVDFVDRLINQTRYMVIIAVAAWRRRTTRSFSRPAV